MIESVILSLIRVVAWVLRAIPYRLSLAVVTLLIRIGYLLKPKLWRITLRNLELAYPESSAEWRNQIGLESIQALARVFVDFARLDRLDSTWVTQHVSCALLERYRQVKREQPQSGVLLITGHLGSFELLGHCMPMFGHPISFVVRNFKMKKIDAWWTRKRQAFGNSVIGRKGAFQDVVHNLRAGRDVAVLFDQNVTRNHAVFADFFGVKTATTKTPALAALRTECPIFVACIAALGDDRYEIRAKELDVRDIYTDHSSSTEKKVLELTQRMTDAYEAMIRAQPGEWFWMHRRFKTRPVQGDENLYAQC